MRYASADQKKDNLAIFNHLFLQTCLVLEINLMLSHLINKNLNTIAGCIVIVFGICFALLITEAQQEGKLGYKTDNRERV